MNIFLGMVGPWQVVIIVALILLLFGGKKIPELMRGLGTGIREFKDATKDPAKDNERIGKPEDEQINKSALVACSEVAFYDEIIRQGDIEFVTGC